MRRTHRRETNDVVFTGSVVVGLDGRRFDSDGLLLSAGAGRRRRRDLTDRSRLLNSYGLRRLDAGDLADRAPDDAVDVAVDEEHGDERRENTSEEVHVDHVAHVDDGRERTWRTVFVGVHLTCNVIAP